MSATIDGFCSLLARSRLLPPDEVKALQQRWQAEAKGNPSDVERFSQWLVGKQYLTEYQATLLRKGHADNFFLDQYKILDRIGRGRMAGVYKAVHQLGQAVAIKVLPPSKAKDPQLLGRFQRETRLAMRLKHPNVVRTFQVGETRGLHYLVMEYLEGETLDEVLQRRGKLPPPDAVRIVYQALLGLQHLHEQAMVHRDLKPGNLMLVPSRASGGELTQHATVKILDIGLGRALFDEGGEGNLQLTSADAILGAPEYMSPEQARNAHAADIRADIYSLGCVLYHALTGQPPFTDTSPVRLLVRHATENPRPLAELNPALPDGLQQIINWMLAKDPAQRYPTPDRAAQALQVYLASGQVAATNPDANPQMHAYLTWLDSQPGDVAIPEGAAVAPSPAVTPTPKRTELHKVAAPPASDPAANPPTKRKTAVVSPVSRPTPAAQAPAARPSQREAPPAAPVTPAADVELVAAPAVKSVPAVGSGLLNLSTRDLIMLGIGVGVTLLAEGVGLGISRLLRRPAESAPTPEPEKPGEEQPEQQP